MALSAGTAVLLSGCGHLGVVFSMDQVEGSGKVTSETRSVPDFKKIQDDGSVNVYVKVGPATSIKIEGDDNLLPLIKTKVKDGTLIISNKKSLHSNKKLLVTVTAPFIEAIDLDGAGNVTVHNLDCPHAHLTLDGAGNLTVTGKADTLETTLDGAGNMMLGGLMAKNAKANLNGAGNVDLSASDSLDATLDGVGNLTCHGHPKEVHKSVDGVGRISLED